METTENNKMIAEFMGLTLSDGDWIGEDFIGHEPTGSMLTRNLRFHKSWDWLMPVATKIIEMKENYLFDMSINHGGNCSLRVRPNYDSSSRGYDILVCEQNKGIETVYKTVVEFIKWYNKSK